MGNKSVESVEKKTELREDVVKHLLAKTAGAMTITRPQLLEVLAETEADPTVRTVRWPYWFTDVAEYRPKRGVYLFPTWVLEMDEYKAYHGELAEFSDSIEVETSRQKRDEVSALVGLGVEPQTAQQYADASGVEPETILDAQYKNFMVSSKKTAESISADDVNFMLRESLRQ